MHKSIITGKFVKKTSHEASMEYYPENDKKMDAPMPANMPNTDKEISPEKFVANLFACRDTVHLLHLNTGSYAAHKALDKMYTKMLGFADSVAEIMQGHMGIMKFTIPSSHGEHDPVEYVTAFRKGIIEAKKHCKLDEIKNLIDEMADLCSSTMYKLKELK